MNEKYPMKLLESKKKTTKNDKRNSFESRLNTTGNISADVVE